MADTKALSASLEDYLEAIYHIVLEKQAARAKDIARRLDVNNSSVTGALRSLSEKGYINYAPYDLITLTAEGKKHAEEVVRRHEALMNFFVKVLCIDEKEASEAASRMKHALSDAIMERLFSFVEFVEICPRGGENWIAEFWKEAGECMPLETCEKCVNKALQYLKQKKKDISDVSAKPVSVKGFGIGQRGVITKIKGRTGLNKRLEEADIKVGSVIEVSDISPSVDVFEIKSRGYRITLNADEASKIMLNPVGETDSEE